MSYCVNCGVELDKSQRVCPLCDTEVINPREEWETPSKTPYPKEAEMIKHLDRIYFAELTGLFMLIPMLTTFLIDIIEGDGVDWSFYVFGALMVLFVCFVVPFTSKKKNDIMSTVLFDAFIIGIYLLMIDLLCNGGWYLSMGLPVLASVTVFMLLVAAFIKNRRGRSMLSRCSISLLMLGGLMIVLEMIINSFLTARIFLSWSPFVLIPCCVLFLCGMVLDTRTSLKAKIRRRLFF